MKRFMKMAGMLIAETGAFIAMIYAMLWITAVMYYNDIIVQRSTLDCVTNAFGNGLTAAYLVIAMVTILKTVYHCVYEKNLKEI